ncbi:hypothetical protein E2C01_019236 [Portunus trituberculatus]|uniref:Uncharacterized protein n=1 Tax=Portunus trituberculatus TaxID=210409 RepID=A0A5B7DXQ4_PORTR|nr:hypothetical protein [Portunus trituberculatus]
MAIDFLMYQGASRHLPPAAPPQASKALVIPQRLTTAQLPMLEWIMVGLVCSATTFFILIEALKMSLL